MQLDLESKVRVATAFMDGLLHLSSNNNLEYLGNICHNQSQCNIEDSFLFFLGVVVALYDSDKDGNQIYFDSL